jgi:hypothetical protein
MSMSACGPKADNLPNAASSGPVPAHREDRARTGAARHTELGVAAEP